MACLRISFKDSCVIRFLVDHNQEVLVTGEIKVTGEVSMAGNNLYLLEIAISEDLKNSNGIVSAI